MHPSAFTYVKHAGRKLAEDSLLVLEFGSYNVNGTVRGIFPNATWHGVDRRPGPCVDEVADAATYDTDKRFDLVVCCEVFEHAAAWEIICVNAARLLKPGGTFIGTAAAPGRAAHSCNGAPMAKPYPEYYENICPDGLKKALDPYFESFEVELDATGEDVRWTAKKKS